MFYHIYFMELRIQCSRRMGEHGNVYTSTFSFSETTVAIRFPLNLPGQSLRPDTTVLGGPGEHQDLNG
ncbi:hypothetical protein TWF281_002411 [Arthrobotrys megalospora]